MKKIILLVSIAIITAHTIFAETWTTIKEKSVKLQTISINESDTELITLAAATTYQDGVAIFYCHAGLREKEILMAVYNFVEEELINNYINVFDITSKIINDFKNEEIIYPLYFETEPLDTSGILPCSRARLYLGSYVDKAASDVLKKKGIKPTEVPEKPIPYNRMNQIMNKYKTKVYEESSKTQQFHQDFQNDKITEKETSESKTESKDLQEEINVSEKKDNEPERDFINISILGGTSLQLKPIIDLNLKILINKYMYVVIQGGGTPVNSASSKILSNSIIPQGTIGFGGCIRPIKTYKMNIFGYASAGLASGTIKGGYIKDGKYTDTSLYPMIRACAGIDFPISNYFAISAQNCFDYLFNIGFTDSISAGITLKL